LLIIFRTNQQTLSVSTTMKFSRPGCSQLIVGHIAIQFFVLSPLHGPTALPFVSCGNCSYSDFHVPITPAKFCAQDIHILRFLQNAIINRYVFTLCRRSLCILLL
jgi:hypothetical protein